MKAKYSLWEVILSQTDSLPQPARDFWGNVLSYNWKPWNPPWFVSLLQRLVSTFVWSRLLVFALSIAHWKKKKITLTVTSRSGRRSGYIFVGRKLSAASVHEGGEDATERLAGGWVWAQTGRPNLWVGSCGSSRSSSRSCQTPWNYTVPFHWEAMSSYVLPSSEYCNAMSIFFLFLFYFIRVTRSHCDTVVTYCLESLVKWEHTSWRTFLFFCAEWKSPGGHKRGTERHGGVAELRDRPFILKGLFVR